MFENVNSGDIQIAKVNGLKIAYETFGNPKDPPMVLIMGLGTQMVFWDDEFCSQLASHHFWVIRFDNRDVGLSSRLDKLGVPDVVELFLQPELIKDFQAPYSLEDMAADTFGLMDELNIESAHIVGTSMGGMIGQVMAIMNPERFLSFASIMSSTGHPSLPPPTAEATQLLIIPSPTDRDGFIDHSVMVWNLLTGSTFEIPEESIREKAALSFERGRSAAGLARQLAAILSNGSRREALKSLRVSTIVIHGNADPLVPVEAGIDTFESIPGAKKLIIEGMGHSLPPAVWPQVIDAIIQNAG